MIDGPWSAPSSPPETPVPMKRSPFSRHSSVRRRVSRNCELPPSITMSPSSSSGSSSPITPSTGAPALTITRIRRGFSSASTNSSSVSPAVNLPSEAYCSMKSFVRAGLRLWTATGTSRLAMLRARFAPITASPVTPIWLSPLIARDNNRPARFATVLCHVRRRALALSREVDGRRAARSGLSRPRRSPRRPPGARAGAARAADRPHQATFARPPRHARLGRQPTRRRAALGQRGGARVGPRGRRARRRPALLRRPAEVRRAAAARRHRRRDRSVRARRPPTAPEPGDRRGGRACRAGLARFPAPDRRRGDRARLAARTLRHDHPRPRHSGAGGGRAPGHPRALRRRAGPERGCRAAGPRPGGRPGGADPAGLSPPALYPRPPMTARASALGRRLRERQRLLEEPRERVRAREGEVAAVGLEPAAVAAAELDPVEQHDPLLVVLRGLADGARVAARIAAELPGCDEAEPARRAEVVERALDLAAVDGEIGAERH